MIRDTHEAVVLVIEDNPDNLFITLELLRTKVRVGYCQGWASDSELFQQYANLPDQQIDLILLDIRLAHEDGYGIIAQIRAHPQLHNVRVIALTANVMVTDVARARAAGFDGFIGKPISHQRFPQQIVRILRNEAVWEARS